MATYRSLKDVLRPIIWLNCIFCMGIFEIPRGRPRFALSVVYTVSVLSVYSVILYQGIILFNEIGSRLIIFYFVTSVNILVATCSIILFWKKSQNFAKVMKRCSVVDDTLQALGIKKNYNKTFHFLLLYIFIWIIFFILLNVMHVIWMTGEVGYLSNIYSTLCFGFPMMVNSVVDLTFGAFVRCLKEKFRYANILINEAMRCANKTSILEFDNRKKNTSVCSVVTVNYKNNKDMTNHIVQTVKHVHLELTRISNKINETYSVQLLLEMAVHFTIITAVLYHMYLAFSGHSSRKIDGKKVAAMIVWELVYSIKIILINNLCRSVSHEAYKTGELIQTSYGYLLDDELREEIRHFTEQIILNPLHFTAAGFFRINNALTGAFFGTVTTYLVILIQMRGGI